MPFGATDMTEIMGIGSYMGELRRGPDGNLYEWVEGVDGLGNPIGFWRKAFSFVKSAAQAVARGALARLIPGPIKRIARRVCGAVDEIGPVVSVIPPVAPFYAGATGLCKVLRGAGIAGVDSGVMEVPDEVRAALTAAIPAPARSAARTVCSVIDRLGPVLRYIPIASSYYGKATGLCRTLRSAGIAGAGADGQIMQAPDGRLYEVIEGIGEFGERRHHLRPVRLVIPAYIGPGRRARHHHVVRRRHHRGRPSVPGARPPAAVHGFGRFY